MGKLREPLRLGREPLFGLSRKATAPVPPIGPCGIVNYRVEQHAQPAAIHFMPLAHPVSQEAWACCGIGMWASTSEGVTRMLFEIVDEVRKEWMTRWGGHESIRNGLGHRSEATVPRFNAIERMPCLVWVEILKAKSHLNSTQRDRLKFTQADNIEIHVCMARRRCIQSGAGSAQWLKGRGSNCPALAQQQQQQRQQVAGRICAHTPP